MSRPPAQETSTEIRALTPACVAWILERHAEHYASVYGFDAGFAALVERVLADFGAHADPERDRGWIAWRGARRAGSLICVGTPDNALKLRLFYVEDFARGQGVGRALLDTLLAHGRQIGADRIEVATFAEHVAAGRLYARNGFVRVASKPVEAFGCAMTEEHWQKPLAPD